MSIKMRVRYQTKYFIQFLHSLALPAWMTGFKARVALAALIVVLGVGYMMQTNASVTGGYVIHNLEQEISQTSQENAQLATQAAAYQSMANIQARLATLQMVAPDKVVYVKNAKATEVASR